MVIWFRTIIICICIAYYPNFVYAGGDNNSSISYFSRVWETIKTDHKNFYSSGRLLRIGVAFGMFITVRSLTWIFNGVLFLFVAAIFALLVKTKAVAIKKETRENMDSNSRIYHLL